MLTFTDNKDKDKKIKIISNLAKYIILNSNNIEEIIKKFNIYLIPHIDNYYFPICTFGVFENYTFYTHGFTNHIRCCRRCIKDCIISYN